MYTRTPEQQAAYRDEEASCMTQIVGESLYWWACDHAPDVAEELHTAATDGAGRAVTPDARKYALELFAEGLSR